MQRKHVLFVSVCLCLHMCLFVHTQDKSKTNTCEHMCLFVYTQDKEQDKSLLPHVHMCLE
jgi:hypothetical protein